MLRNFFKTAARNIARNKVYSIINFIGLTCGVALALLIIVYVRSEVSYDTFQENGDRLYRIAYKAPNGLDIAASPPPIAPLMTEFFPEVEMAGRMYNRSVSIKKPESQDAFEENGIFFTDSTVMKMLTFEFVQGSPVKALNEKFTVILNQTMATKYFGNENPVGETLIFGGKNSFKVVGVVKDYPDESHLQFNMLVPYENMYDMETDETSKRLRQNFETNFVISHSYTYVLLKPGADPTKVDEGMSAFLKKYALPNRIVGQIFTLFPVRDIHMNSTMVLEPNSTNSWTSIFIFVGVGLLTIVIACINYINLSTAQSFRRVKEIGIRKILGSLKGQIIAQFLAESFLFCVVSFALAFVVFYYTLPQLNILLGKNLLFENVVDFKLMGFAVALIVLITLMAGGYPSYFVTKFNSVNALKGNGSMAIGDQWLRKTLIVFQLATACLLLSGSLLIVKQMNYISSRPLGFKKDHIINVPLFSQNLNGLFNRQDSTFRNRIRTFQDQIEGQTGIMGTSLTSSVPGLGIVFRGAIPDGFTQQDNLFVACMGVDYDFFKLYEVDLVTGRPFQREFGTDVSSAFIINETAVREFKWESPEKAIGKSINREGKVGQVVGVMKDINFTTLTQPISALIVEVDPSGMNTLSIRFENINIDETIGKIRTQWAQMFPEKSFQFTFLDEQLNQQYQNFTNFGLIIQSFAFIAILISCLGVYGLVLFVVQRKVKEIGVRKVLGASVPSILRLIYKDFALLTIIGFALAVPASWYLLDSWLENFTYRTTIDVWTYVLSFVIVLVITSLTICYQALRASLANPTTSLRTE